ncbi:hypothetical protein CDV50_09240 [Haematobacter massiliensis]|uniref:Uncharacterized protein n=1 Tax=Haematobacter massiliensis TaxID=195105 RepID=A0A086YAW4_9RHOB|nr:DUF2948 family protein [Haematobacter massiliensis]KFI31414.1 hypothetical protein CN97_10430 [Haematobacter massiliensis]OWJ71684.1 hypothetical protein CDV50_09240 [Haematobacter massiliensis]OWJ88121.1 hypothetical protein CDV51_03315 [Haematobacter massiliensis]QBJ23495.1 DUF2948 family protein [Haematobacter massiliensis]
MTDARFEDGAPRQPLNLAAVDGEDVMVISALLQDSVLPVTEMRWQPAQRRFALLANRFRWEDTATTEKDSAPERVQSLLIIEDALRVATQGLDRGDADVVLSLLTLAFEPAEDGAGRITLTFAGDGAIAIDVECINLRLRDVTRPYLAPSRTVPRHAD